MDEPISVPTFKVVLCGDSGVGKTAWVERLLSSRFVAQQTATIGTHVHTIFFHTNMGPTIKFEIIEISGQHPQPNGYDVWSNSCLKDWQAGIIMFDVTTRLSYKNVPNWHYDMMRHKETSDNEGNVNIPFVLCGNKVDVKDRKVKPQLITFHRKKKLQYYDISVKSSYNCKMPLLWLARKFMNNEALEFVSSDWKPWPFDNAAETILSEKYRADLMESSPRPKDFIDLEILASKMEDTKINSPTEDSKECHVQDPAISTPGIDFSEKTVTLAHDHMTETKALDLQKEDFESSKSRENLFVLCTHCIRMIFIETLSSDTSSSTSVYSLAITNCRSCRKQRAQGESSSPLGNRISPELIRSTRLYECCARIAGDEATVKLFVNKNEGSKTVSFMSTDDVAAKMSGEDRIHSVNTEHNVLHKLDKLTREELLLPYVLGGFF